MTTRRAFLATSAGATVGAVVTAAIAGVRVPVVQAQPRVQPESPDAGGFLRLHGWGVCVPPQEWAQHGAWVIDGVMAALQPARWHSWGIWPSTNAPGRVPMVFSDQWFDRPATRQYLTDHPACEWQTFNEPELPQQANMTPEQAVDVTLEFIEMGRSVGNEFQWMAPSVTLDTEHNGLGWLTEYMVIMRRKKGIMRPSSWAVHPYTCNSVAALRESMRKWWAWWDVWGSGAPTIITEVCAEDAPLSAQIAVMDECAAMLRSKAVLGVMWFAAYASESVPWLHYPLTVLNHETQTVTLTDLGRHWKGLQ